MAAIRKDNQVLCFGELLLRISPVLNRRWIQDAAFPVFIGGAELNVATALSKWEIPAKYCTTLPDNYLSKEIIAELNDKQIDTSAITFSGDRIGTYYLPQGTDLKNAGVIYDRFYSSFYELTPGSIDWDAVLDGCTWFHFSAISPALNQNIANVCKEALTIASAKGLTISVDLNYRSKLWKYGKAPIKIMPELVKYCDVVMGNIWAANTLLGIPVDELPEGTTNKDTYLKHATFTYNKMQEQFPKCKLLANTFRFDNGSGIKYFTTLNDKNGQYVSHEFHTDKVVDKIGSGDCFMAGLIYGLYKQQGGQNIIDFATAAAFGKLNEVGDATNQTAADVIAMMH